MKWRTLPASQLDRLVKAGKSVFVLNTSVMPSGDKGTIVVNFFDGTRRDYFKMPPTFIPMAISDVIPPNNLVGSRDFKQCLVKGMLTMVDPDQAEEYMQTPDAIEEYESLVLAEHSSRMRNLDINSEVTKRSKVTHTENSGDGPLQDIVETETISNRVRGLVEAMNSNEKDAKTVLIELRRHQSAFSAADIGFVMQNSPPGQLKQWCVKAMSELTGSTEQKPAAPVKKVATAKKVVKKDETAFDFVGEADMTPAERAEEARNMSKISAQQAMHGESKAADMINDMIQGKSKY